MWWSPWGFPGWGPPLGWRLNSFHMLIVDLIGDQVILDTRYRISPISNAIVEHQIMNKIIVNNLVWDNQSCGGDHCHSQFFGPIRLRHWSWRQTRIYSRCQRPGENFTSSKVQLHEGPISTCITNWSRTKLMQDKLVQPPNWILWWI